MCYQMYMIISNNNAGPIGATKNKNGGNRISFHHLKVEFA